MGTSKLLMEQERDAGTQPHTHTQIERESITEQLAKVLSLFIDTSLNL